MSTSCQSPAGRPVPRADDLPAPAAPVETLREVARRYGTPTYAYDLGRIRAQIARLKAALPPAATSGPST